MERKDLKNISGQMPHGSTATMSQWQEKETNTCAGRACYTCKRFQFLTRLQDAAAAVFMLVYVQRH